VSSPRRTPRASRSTLRSGLVLLGALALATPALAACGAGRNAEVYRERQTTDLFNAAYANRTLYVSGGYVAEPVYGNSARAYAVVTSTTAAGDVLTGASVRSDEADGVALRHLNPDGSLGATVSQLTVPPQGQVRIMPDAGLALVITGIKRLPVLHAQLFHLTLTFQRAGTLPEMTFLVTTAGAPPGSPAPGAAPSPTPTPTATPSASASASASALVPGTATVRATPSAVASRKS
jgi:hypothetical protein